MAETSVFHKSKYFCFKIMYEEACNQTPSLFFLFVFSLKNIRMVLPYRLLSFSCKSSSQIFRKPIPSPKPFFSQIYLRTTKYTGEKKKRKSPQDLHIPADNAFLLCFFDAYHFANYLFCLSKKLHNVGTC